MAEEPRVADSLELLAADIVSCRACPRLVAWREQAATQKRAAFTQETYWGRPVPGFGEPDACLLVVGLAPAAHGANRTGRMFTGDRSGAWLYRALYRAGFANQPTSIDRSDGLRLEGAYVTAAVRCAPPANKPLPTERDRCRLFLQRELALLTKVRVIVALGKFAFDVVVSTSGLRPRPRFSHGVEVQLGERTLIGSYHVSQQNTFTGRLTEEMLDRVFDRARLLCQGF
ncbi:MAG: uracil-DNA glycosylase [Acidimicrobiales bacterium]|nr:uracil-DNA glycosylase [Acidimicrobiales bacterium]